MDSRRELNYITRQLDRFAQNMGETVLWWELDTANTTIDPIFGESPSRVYRPPVRIMAIQVDETEPTEQAGPEGRRPTQTIRAGFTAATLRESGITFVHGNAQQHLNDVISYNGRYYEVSRFDIQGRLRGDVIIGISGVETFEFEEDIFDAAPPTTPSTEPKVI
jgi:hypothetical protein